MANFAPVDQRTGIPVERRDPDSESSTPNLIDEINQILGSSAEPNAKLHAIAQKLIPAFISQLEDAKAELLKTQNVLAETRQHDAGTAVNLLSAEQALRESEEKFHSLADYAPFSIFIHDGKKFLYVNRTTAEVTGYSREQLMRMDLWDLIHPHSIPFLRERFRDRANGKSVASRFEAKIITKQGEEKWIYFSGSQLRYQGKQAVISGAVDITEQRRGDEELRLTQERVRLASESAGISTWQWAIRTNKVTASPELYRIFGLNEADLGGRFEEFLTRLHEEDQVRVRQSIERAVSEQQDLDVEFRLMRGDGSWAWAHTRAKVFYDALKQPERMIGVTIDVTAAKLANQALHESEQRFRATFSHLGIGMTQNSLDGTILLANKKFCDIVGYADHEVAGRSFQDFTHPDDLEASLRKMGEMLFGATTGYSLEKRYIHKDGSVVWVHVNASLVTDSEGKPKYVIAAVEDITERRRAAEALRNSEKLAATGRLAASIAHEINNPLESVTNLLYLLERNPSLNNAGQSYARMAQEELSRVAHIARQTLGFYRDSAQLEPIRLRELMDGVLELFGRKIRNAEVEVEKDYGIVGVIEGFPGEIRQVLSNLLANALDAVGKRGKIKIRIRRSRTWTARGPKGIRLTLADNGPGISAANRKHLFEPFFTTKGAKGTGLGLWVSRGMIEKHGGTIRVRSSVRPGESGTVFSLFLPLRQRSESARRKQIRH
jgi:PAS domain S-box-containing protein